MISVSEAKKKTEANINKDFIFGEFNIIMNNIYKAISNYQFFNY